MEFLDIIHPIGKVIHSTDVNFDPNVTFGGVWSRDNTGTITVSKTNSSDVFDVNVGEIVGEDTANASTPSHNHTAGMCGCKKGGAWGGSYGNISGTRAESLRGGSAGFRYAQLTMYTNYLGGGESHENMMKFNCVIRWIRTA